MFSVVVPVYNHKSFIEEAVESAVGDDLVHEILLVDDLSSDGSAELIEEFPRRYGHKVKIIGEARKSNKGAHRRINQLCDRAAGPWISILNSDDAFTPGRFAIARDLAASQDCNFITGALNLIDASSAAIREKKGNLDPDYPLPSTLASADLNTELNLFRVLCSENVIMTTSNMLFTKGLFVRLSGFRDLRYCHDWDFALRACLEGRPGFSHAPLTRYRIHAANTIQPTPHVDGEVIRLFSRLLADFPWVEEDRLAVASLKGNRHLGTLVSDADIGRKGRDRRPPRADRSSENADGRPRCLVLADHDDQDELIDKIRSLRSNCDLHVIAIGKSEQSPDDFLETLERARDEVGPAIVYVCGGLEWCSRNASQIRRVFANSAVVDEHSLHDVEKWCAYYRSKAINAFDRFIVDSGVIAHVMVTQCGIPRNRIDVIQPRMEPSMPEAGTGQDHRGQLAFASPLTTDSHLLGVFDLARRCRECGWPDIFVIAGPGQLPDACMRYATAARLGNIRRIANDVIDGAVLQSADGAIALSPSLSSSTALVALSHGKPFLGIATEDAKSLLNQFGSGVAVDENAGQDLAWQNFVEFRASIASLTKAARNARGALCNRFSESYRRKAYGEAFTRATRQVRGTSRQHFPAQL